MPRRFYSGNPIYDKKIHLSNIYASTRSEHVMSSYTPENTKYDYLSPCRPPLANHMDPPTRFTRRKGKNKEEKLAQFIKAYPCIDALESEELQFSMDDLAQLIREWGPNGSNDQATEPSITMP
jgi:hypothetical protein